MKPAIYIGIPLFSIVFPLILSNILQNIVDPRWSKCTENTRRSWAFIFGTKHVPYSSEGPTRAILRIPPHLRENGSDILGPRFSGFDSECDQILKLSMYKSLREMIGFGRDFTKTVVTLAQEGVRGSSWALEYAESRGESISGTFRAVTRDPGARILKKPIFQKIRTKT